MALACFGGQPYRVGPARDRTRSCGQAGAVSDIRTRREIIEAGEGNGGPDQPREDAVKGLVQHQAEADADDVDHARRENETDGVVGGIVG